VQWLSIFAIRNETAPWPFTSPRFSPSAPVFPLMSAAKVHFIMLAIWKVQQRDKPAATDFLEFAV
jgi:hypothetical protein